MNSTQQTIKIDALTAYAITLRAVDTCELVTYLVDNIPDACMQYAELYGHLLAAGKSAETGRAWTVATVYFDSNNFVCNPLPDFFANVVVGVR